MSVIKFIRSATGLFNWNTDNSPTSEEAYMNAVKNWHETEKNLVDTVLWQPTTAYTVGNMVKTPSLPSQYCLVCTHAGTSGANEPSYSGVNAGSSVSDGSVTWTISGYVHEQAKTTGSGSTSMSSTALATNLTSLYLSAGTWIVSAKMGFSPNNNGNRALMIYHNINSSKVSEFQEVRQSVGAMDLNGTAIVCLYAATTVYLQGYQTSGSNLTVTWEMRAQKLSDYTSFSA